MDLKVVAPTRTVAHMKVGTSFIYEGVKYLKTTGLNGANCINVNFGSPDCGYSRKIHSVPVDSVEELSMHTITFHSWFIYNDQLYVKTMRSGGCRPVEQNGLGKEVFFHNVHVTPVTIKSVVVESKT